MNKRILIRLGVYWGLFFGFLFIANPAKLPIFLLIVPYIVLFLALRLSWQLSEGLLRPEASNKRYFAERSNLFAAIAVSFLALASIGQLTLRDVSTVTLLALIGYFYLTRNSSKAE
jgi:exosortase/archaeosortase